MKTTLILAAAALTAFCAPAYAQSAVTPPSQTAAPVMPAPREPTNPSANITPMNNAMTEGRAVAPSIPATNAAPMASRSKMHTGANGG